MRHTKTVGKPQLNGPYWRVPWWDRDGVRAFRNLGRADDLTKRDLARLVQEWEAEVEQMHKAPARGTVPTLSQWRERYHEVKAGLSEDSAELSGVVFDALIKHFGDVPLDTISVGGAADFRASVQARTTRGGEKISQQTVRKWMRYAKAIYSLAVRHEVVASNPFRHEQSAVLRIDKSWAYVRADQVPAILEHATSDGLRGLIVLCRLCAMRRDEARAVAWSDVDWQARTIRVRSAKRGEGTVAYRDPPMESQAYTILRSIFDRAPEGSHGPCSGLPDGETYIYAAMRAALLAAKVPLYAKPFHTLRKNCVSDWKTRFPSPVVDEWAGHDEAVSRAHYVAVPPDVLARATGVGIDPKTRIAELEAELAALKAQAAIAPSPSPSR